LFLGFVQESFGALGADEQGRHKEREEGYTKSERASQECSDGRVVEAVESEQDEKQKEQCRSTVEEPKNFKAGEFAVSQWGDEGKAQAYNGADTEEFFDLCSELIDVLGVQVAVGGVDHSDVWIADQDPAG
jgi:hypothetical protein